MRNLANIFHACSSGEFEIKPEYICVTEDEKELTTIQQHGEYIRSGLYALARADNFSHNFVSAVQSLA